MTPRTVAFLMLGYAFLSGAARGSGLEVPVLKIPFLGPGWLGWVLLAGVLAVAGWLLGRGVNEWHFSPLTMKQWGRFKAIRRGYVSFWLLIGLVVLGALDTVVVGKRALVVRYEGEWSFPFVTGMRPALDFGMAGEGEADYRELREKYRREGGGNFVVMPLVPYAPTLDSPDMKLELAETVDGRVTLPDGEPFNGRAYTVFKDKPTQQRREWVIRDGVKAGEMRGWNREGEQVEKAVYAAGRRVAYEDYTGGGAAALEGDGREVLETMIYPPAAPSWRHRHFLGTTTLGNDVLAVLYGGWQQAIIASVLFVIFVFTVGVVAGGALGYFGGWFDLLGQRLLEIWNSLPFLFIVMIVASILSPSLLLLVGIIALFSWMGTTTYLRTATYREKSRDYVASARLLGAGTGRILFRHILPNSIAILVTLAPFEVAAIISSLAALDFVGFGLPPEDPSWGRLLREGTENFNYPWIVTSSFVAMVTVLVLVTFVGEAIREAFDPKKFTTYR